MNEFDKREQTRLLEIGSSLECYCFARDVSGADIPALQARVLEIGNGYDCYRFASDILGADIQALQARVLEIGVIYDCRVFARDVSGADILALQAREKQLKEKGKNMKDHEKRELVNALTEVAVKYGNTQQLRERIAHLVLPAFAECEEKLEAERRLAYQYKQEKECWVFNANALQKGYNELDTKYRECKEKMNESDKQEQARVLEIGYGFECYRFAHDIPGADIPALQAREKQLKENEK